MIRTIDGKPITIYEYLSLMKWAKAMAELTKQPPNTLIETNHFIMDVLGGPIFKY